VSISNMVAILWTNSIKSFYSSAVMEFFSFTVYPLWFLLCITVSLGLFTYPLQFFF